MKKIFPTINKKQSVEFGQLVVLICLLLTLYEKSNRYLIVAVILLLITMIVPIVFYPFARCWFGLSGILGAFSSRLLLSLVFFLVVLPMGIGRKLLGKDSLKLKQFKKDKSSVMSDRYHVYSKKDLENTF